MNRQRKVVITVTYNELGVIVDTKAEELDSSAQPATNCSEIPNGSDDTISRQAAIDALDCINGAEEVLRALPSVQPEPKWIPCSERLPERADNVIICYKAGDYTLVSTGRYLYKFKMWYVDVVGDLKDGVTAWMPLPEPYRGGET